jgi:hypothetical protein
MQANFLLVTAAALQIRIDSFEQIARILETNKIAETDEKNYVKFNVEWVKLNHEKKSFDWFLFNLV